MAYTDKIEAWQFGGEACVVDVRDLLDQAPKGVSPLVKPEHVERFEKQHRPFDFGDVVLFRSDYSDKYYRPFPEGSRFIADVLDRKTPGFPDPDPDCMEFLATRGVMTLGTDSASMGPLPDLAEPTHYAGLKHGMIWTEERDEPGGAAADRRVLLHARAEAPRGPVWRRPGVLDRRRRLAAAADRRPAENKRAIDLSPTLAPKLPLTSPGIGTGQHRQVYLKIDFLYSEYLDLWHHAHLMDAMAGTHLVPPVVRPAAATADQPAYAPEVRGWLDEYEKKYGPRGTSSLTTEQVPLDWTCGPVRVIDVRSLVGSTDSQDHGPLRPRSRRRTSQEYEEATANCGRATSCCFTPGISTSTFAPRPNDAGVWTDPLQGKSEGWPAPGPDAIVLSEEQRDSLRGDRCAGPGRRRSAARLDDLLGARQPRDGRRRVPAATSAQIPRDREPISCSPRSRFATATADPAGRSCCTSGLVASRHVDAVAKVPHERDQPGTTHAAESRLAADSVRLPACTC